MDLNQLLDAILRTLNFVYGERWVAPFVLVPAMLALAAVIHIYAWATTRSYLRAARRRIKAIRRSLGKNADPIAERNSFSENFVKVSEALNRNDGAPSIVQAWREFHETIIDETTTPIRNTSRPSAFFNRVAPRQTLLIFWSNVFVGLGLILTFLGLIVALNTASRGMQGHDVAGAQSALIGLLTVSSAKFFTSVAGLLASIWLRFAEHGLTSRVHRVTETMCGLLERGLLYVPVQRLAIEQLRVLEEQRDQLKFFNTDVAMQIGDRIGAQFQQTIAPLAASLASMNDNMTSMTSGIGAGAREAIEKVSGEQLRGLSETLGALGLRLEGISGAVGSSGDEAARQIREAGENFAQAARDLRTAFEALATRVDGIGVRIAEQTDTATQAQNQALSKLMEGLTEAQSRSRDTILEAVTSLRNAGAEAASTMQREVGTALKSGVEESQRTFKAAVEESGDGLRLTAEGLSRAFGDAASKVERAGNEFVQTGQAVERTAQSMDEITGRARSISASLGDAAKGFATATQPLATAAQAIDDAADRIVRGKDAEAAALRSLQQLSEGVRATQEAAETAWRNYRDRFEGVDKAIASVTERLAATLGESLGEFRKFATEFDMEMAKAVSRLGTTVEGIHEFAETLENYVERTDATREAAE